MSPTKVELAWAAGLLEGEGCFTLNGPSKRTPMVGLNMTDRDVVEKFAQIFKLPQTIYTYQYGANRKPVHQLRIIGKRAVGLMLTLFSFLCRRRRERIKEVLKIWQSARARRQTKKEVIFV